MPLTCKYLPDQIDHVVHVPVWIIEKSNHNILDKKKQYLMKIDNTCFIG